MKSILATAFVSLLGIAHAVDMSKYAPGPGVEPQFKTYLQALYANAEAPKATDAFTNFFTKTGKLIVLSNTAVGAAQILALKQKLLPPNGNKHWNHFPNATTVYSQTANSKTYQVLGVIDSTYDGGNCSAAYYSTRFEVTKAADGTPQLTPHSGSLLLYDDYVVDPAESPTHIPCEH